MALINTYHCWSQERKESAKGLTPTLSLTCDPLVLLALTATRAISLTLSYPYLKRNIRTKPRRGEHFVTKVI